MIIPIVDDIVPVGGGCLLELSYLEIANDFLMASAIKACAGRK